MCTFYQGSYLKKKFRFSLCYILTLFKYIVEHYDTNKRRFIFSFNILDNYNIIQFIRFSFVMFSFLIQ